MGIKRIFKKVFAVSDVEKQRAKDMAADHKIIKGYISDINVNGLAFKKELIEFIDSSSLFGFEKNQLVKKVKSMPHFTESRKKATGVSRPTAKKAVKKAPPKRTKTMIRTRVGKGTVLSRRKLKTGRRR